MWALSLNHSCVQGSTLKICLPGCRLMGFVQTASKSDLFFKSDLSDRLSAGLVTRVNQQLIKLDLCPNVAVSICCTYYHLILLLNIYDCFGQQQRAVYFVKFDGDFALICIFYELLQGTESAWQPVCALTVSLATPIGVLWYKIIICNFVMYFYKGLHSWTKWK